MNLAVDGMSPTRGIEEERRNKKRCERCEVELKARISCVGREEREKNEVMGEYWVCEKWWWVKATLNSHWLKQTLCDWIRDWNRDHKRWGNKRREETEKSQQVLLSFFSRLKERRRLQSWIVVMWTWLSVERKVGGESTSEKLDGEWRVVKGNEQETRYAPTKRTQIT